MFKSTSQNNQLRSRRVALEARGNTGGIDPAVFKPTLDPEPSLRDELVLNKLNLEKKGREIRDQMAVATSRKRNRQSGQLDDEAFRRLGQQYKAIRDEIIAIDAKLLGLRADRRAGQDRRRLAEAEIFVETARELLADPIFKELMRRTVERIPIPGSGT